MLIFIQPVQLFNHLFQKLTFPLIIIVWKRSVFREWALYYYFFHALDLYNSYKAYSLHRKRLNIATHFFFFIFILLEGENILISSKHLPELEILIKPNNKRTISEGLIYYQNYLLWSLKLLLWWITKAASKLHARKTVVT